MVLINADELWKHKFKSASERMDLSVTYMGGWNDAIDSIVENAPAVDAVPVVHARWVKPTKIGWRNVDVPHCSHCKEIPCGVDMNTHYCPNCGAKMDKEAE